MTKLTATHWPYSPTNTFVLLLPLAWLFALCLDLILPAIPTIQYHFAIEAATMQITNTIFLLACGLCYLVIGPISDQIGRRPTALYSLILACLGTILCYIAPHISWLFIGRILQAIGACGSYLCAYASIRDLTDDEASCSIFYGRLNVAVGLSPMLAPSLGAWIMFYSHWRHIFGVLIAVIAATFVFCHRYYLETQHNSQATSTKQLTQQYRLIWSNSIFQRYTFIAAVGMGSFFSFYSLCPYIVQEHLQRPESDIAWYFGLVGFAFLLASLLSKPIIARCGSLNALRIGTALYCLGSVLALGWHLYYPVSITSFITPMIICIGAAAIMIAASIGCTMMQFKQEVGGQAFAMISCYKFFFSALMGSIVMQLPTDSVLPIGTVFTILGLVAMLFSRNKAN